MTTSVGLEAQSWLGRSGGECGATHVEKPDASVRPMMPVTGEFQYATSRTNDVVVESDGFV
ncbi:MAG: hypothetical protein QNJ12_08055 [Ilumatobacter sp.]|uniref:hypothetical protein n=1 Tax=Ilumatobacter sp. TaxID=1967498 RepID=UPI00260B0D3C|nr:hypothetical protein [Ilumatobacter sp.]MDJ0768732.1 hypothetical protein [Ilumatobacter sp.]